MNELLILVALWCGSPTDDAAYRRATQRCRDKMLECVFKFEKSKDGKEEFVQLKGEGDKQWAKCAKNTRLN